MVEYHGAQRVYNREGDIGGLNLNPEETGQQSSQHALYNSANKYQNVKTQLAAGYVRELIASQAGAKSAADDLNKTLKELFAIFFPGKEFLGTQPTAKGRLLFNVKTQSGAVHDINDLSSGEKEILYGYLRLRNSNLRNSIILIDEPELHLNPKLTYGLADFYHKHIGRALGNQLWLVTHSDALLRQAVGNPNYKVFHMQVAGTIPIDQNQAEEIKATAEVEKVLLELVGDLAVYSPTKNVVVLEGGGDSDFDETMILKLFPKFASEVNLVSSENKQRVRTLHDVLEKARVSGKVPFEFYSITDKDMDEGQDKSVANRFQWDRYHIENYLLEPKFLIKVIRALNLTKTDSLTDKTVMNSLKSAARKSLQSLVRNRLEDTVNRRLVSCINVKVSRKSPSISRSLNSAVTLSKSRLEESVSSYLTLDQITKLERKFRAEFTKDLSSSRWLRSFAGREVLTQFVHETFRGSIGYSYFRNLLISSMQEEGFQPKGMKKILDQISDR